MNKAIMFTLGILFLAGCVTPTKVSSTQVPMQEPTQEPTQIPTQVPTEAPTQVPTDTKIPATDTPEPTATKAPATNTPEPTPTPVTPTVTPLPKGILFRDDFEGYFQPGWKWINEDATRWSFVEGGWLEIIGDDKAFYLEDDYGMVNFLTRDVPDGEFKITAHIQANPNVNFQQAAIYIFENPDNYIALNIGYCGPCSTGGPGFYM